MKLLNYDKRTLILQNVKSITTHVPETYSKTQYQILCKLIEQKHISESFFNLLLLALYDLQDWKKLSYSQMYELIHILTYFDYEKVRV